YQASTVDDDSGGGSAGNGDGLVNPGETIELRVQLRNFGSQNATGVTATLTSDDPYVTILDGQESFGDIPAGATAWSADDFDIRIDLGCPDAREIRLGLDVASGADLWHSLIDLSAVAADLVNLGTTLYNAGGNGLLDPGETVEMSSVLRNAGHATASSVVGHLSSLSPYLTVVDGTAGFGTIPISGSASNSGDRFVISASSETFPGHLATFALQTEFSGGVRDTTVATVVVGQRVTTDPVGPDAYGYYAFDNTDISYEEAPTYAWVEIDPDNGGAGTEINLTDFGGNQDDTERVDLPFPFTYYGQTYNRISVCSNGWIVMGWSYLSDHRNWTIPGAGGPQGIIAAFWDDIRLTSGGEVYYWHDAANHRFIIEWSRVFNDQGGAETFEIILYDPAYHETSTGDGPIVFQYMAVTNNDSADNYATTGIESPDGTTGILYTFYNTYASGAATLAAGRAIRFVPVMASPMGTLSGYVRNGSAGGTPVAGAEVRVLETGRTFVTAGSGRYEGTHAGGTYTMVASHAGFEPDTALGVVVVPSQTTTRDFVLIDNLGPAIATTLHPSTTDTLGPYLIPVTISDASGLSMRSFYYRGASASYTEAPLVFQGGDSYLAEIPGQSYITRVEYYVYAKDTSSRETYDPPGAPALFHSFFVTPETSLFADEMEIDQGWTVGAPDDDATTGIWERVDPNATYLDQTMVQPEDDHTAAPGTLCFITGQSAVGADQGANDVDGGKTTLTSPLLNLSSYGTVRLEYYRWFTNDTGNDPGQDPWVVQISDDDGQSWVSLENTTTSARSWTRMEFDLGDYISLTPVVRLRFVASDYPSGAIVEAGVDDVRLLLTGVVGAPETNAGPSVFSLLQCRPNPCGAAGTSIGFSLAHPGTARLDLYDIQGRAVRRLLDGPRPAGLQSVVWDGRDEGGAAAPSGIYLYRLRAGGRNEVRKLIRIE
ncbi:MAG: T9SS type A sorting domain-containing protein, partial [Candidatus Eisenbacteria bacterium]|nr:T9SS type A sorting domain-containing protein [Candidatus Eisenbacteria bacterium]